MQDTVGSGTVQGMGLAHAISDLSNPLLDLELIREMQDWGMATSSGRVKPKGATPGTAIRSLYLEVEGARTQQITSLERETQWSFYRVLPDRRYPIQMDIRKFKRLKMLLALDLHFPHMFEQDISSIFSALSTSPILDFCLGYGDPRVSVSMSHTCGYCHGYLVPLKRTASHPFIGFIPLDLPLYGECRSCGLVCSLFLPNEDSLSILYDEYDFLDFEMTTSTGNPYGEGSSRCDFSGIESELPETGVAIDLGGGTGRFCAWFQGFRPHWTVVNSDFQTKVGSDEDIETILEVAIDLNSDVIGNEDFDLITAWEVVEHLHPAKLDSLLNRVHDALKPGGFFVFSTPDFDAPECLAADFYAACFPFHLTVMSETWVQKWTARNRGWEYLPARWNCDLFDDWSGWTSYLDEIGETLSTVGFAKSLESFVGQLGRPKTQDSGSEIVVTLRKAP